MEDKDFAKDWDKLFAERDERKKNIYNKSVGQKKPIKRNNRTSERLIAIALAIVLTVSGIGIGGAKLKQKFDKAEKANKAADLVKKDAEKVLLQNGLAEYDEENNIVIKNNSVEDYNKLDIDNASFEELYAYSLALDKGDEFDKLIRSVQGVDGVHNYTDLSQFYSYNGFNGTEGGYVEFQKVAKEKLLEAYENGLLNEVVKQSTSDNRGR